MRPQNRAEPIAVFAEELGSGLYPSEPGRKSPFWVDGRNITFDYGHTQSAFGQFVMFITEQNEPITGIKATVISGLQTIFYGTPSKLYKWDATNGIEDLTGSTTPTGTINNPWSFARWGNWMLASNGVDPVQVYKNTGNFVDLSGPTFTSAKIIYTTETHALAANTSDGGNIIAWSDLDDIEDWASVVSNDAGEKPMRNLDSDIISLKQLGDIIIAYTFNEMFAVNYIGRPYVFGTQFLLEGFGPVGLNAVAAVGRKHYGFGPRGIWVTDGTAFEYIQSPALLDFIFRDETYKFDARYGEQVVAWHDNLQNQVIFYYPTVRQLGYNDIGIGLNYKNNTWTIYDYGRTAVDDSGVFPYAITGGQGGNIFQQSVADSPPLAGDAGIVDVTEATFSLELALGEGGLGDGGLGGYTDGTG